MACDWQQAGLAAGEQRRAVDRLLRRRDLTPRVRERAEMVQATALGFSQEAIVGWTGRSARTVERWVARFAAGGLAALADAPRPGRLPKADAASLAALEAALASRPRARGLECDVWTARRLSAYLAERTGVRLAVPDPS